jgi:hypothetical protein
MPNESLEAEVSILRELFRREAEDGEQIALPLGPFSAYILIGLCQLGVRTVQPGDGRAQIFKRIAEDLEPLFTGTAAGALIEASWNQLREEGR